MVNIFSKKELIFIWIMCGIIFILDLNFFFDGNKNIDNTVGILLLFIDFKLVRNLIHYDKSKLNLKKE